jgi:hypothetical protein
VNGEGRVGSEKSGYVVKICGEAIEKYILRIAGGRLRRRKKMQQAKIE